jgi:hypothetical protein
MVRLLQAESAEWERLGLGCSSVFGPLVERALLLAIMVSARIRSHSLITLEPLTHGDAALQKKATHLLDRGPLPN